VALTFEVDEWGGEPYPGDPDGYVTECAFFSPKLAAELLSALPWRSMREPGIAAVMQTGGPTGLFEYSDL
jgi:hypothetical protein